jgi:hypothetical protein
MASSQAELNNVLRTNGLARKSCSYVLSGQYLTYEEVINTLSQR